MYNDIDKTENCTCQPDVWVFDELPPDRQVAVAAHVRACSACQSVWRQAEALKATLRLMEPAMPGHSAALTHRVMQALPPPRARTGAWARVGFSTVRYAIHSAAIVLICWFAWEYPLPQTPVAMRPLPPQPVILNTHAFVTKYYERRRQTKRSPWYARYQHLKKAKPFDYAQLR
ncbi:MAG: hypothetical protein MUC38_06260 [Cyclobacteriaceae bacterium]|jgi:hypothetical protein|nr:hypothetical protein [Cyclobacteriaceae bacterium]